MRDVMWFVGFLAILVLMVVAMGKSHCLVGDGDFGRCMDQQSFGSVAGGD